MKCTKTCNQWAPFYLRLAFPYVLYSTRQLKLLELGYQKSINQTIENKQNKVCSTWEIPNKNKVTYITQFDQKFPSLCGYHCWEYFYCIYYSRGRFKNF